MFLFRYYRMAECDEAAARVISSSSRLTSGFR
jgi:hypothetical protein